MKKQTSISFWLLFTLGMAATVFTSCSKMDSKDDPSITATGIALDETTLSLAIGEEYTLTATVTPTDATTVTWTSSDAAKATVANGKVIAVAAGAVTITAKAGDKTATSTVTVLDGVIINGVIWATKNVAAPGTFATSTEAAGMFYQWNSKVGWPATGAIGSITATDGSTTWNSTWNGGFTTASAYDTWSSANNPCPTGYRVPTYAEIETLLDTTKVTQTWATYNSVYGEKFTDKTTGNSIFLPASGYRNCYYFHGTLVGAGSYGYYWGSTTYNADYACILNFLSSGADRNDNYRVNGQSVRPVAE